MAVPVYEARFKRWLSQQGATFATRHYSRPESQGEVHALHLKPCGDVRGRVLFAHATGNDALFPQVTLFQSLIAAKYEVFSFDLDGHGRQSTTILNPKTFASAISSAVAAAGRGWDQVHFMGQSLGAALCLRAVALQQVQALTLTLLTLPVQLVLSKQAMLAEARALLLPSFWAQHSHYGYWGVFPAFGPLKRHLYPIRLPESTRSEDYVATVTKLINNWRLEELAPNVSCPTLFVLGGRDLIAPAAQVKSLAARLPDARLLIAEGETHYTTTLRQDICQQITKFLDQLPAPAKT